MKRDDFPGRLVLLITAYAPAVVIVGCRLLPKRAGVVVLLLGVAGVMIWALFLLWLPNRQPRAIVVADLAALDTEVTGYIASYLLPIVAVGAPSGGDIAAYAVCAVLLLVVAFAADLGAVNPVVYLFGLRVARATVDGESIVLIAKRLPLSGAQVRVARALGVVRLLDE